jgi:ABC-2 type transport system permease protein
MRTLTEFFSGVGVIVSLELRQRVRGVSWYILLGVFAALVLVVTAMLALTLGSFGDTGGGIFSTLIYFVLLLGTLVAPALSGNAINGDRDAGTLATTQITLITTWQLIVGKFLAAWVTALAFLAVAVPFLAFASLIGELTIGTIVVSTLVLALELGVVAAIGVGLSGILNRPLFSIVLTYLVVAALSIGTLIAFVLGGLAWQVQVTATSTYGTTTDTNGNPIECDQTDVTTYPSPTFDRVWGFLAANPYVIVADAVPTQFDASGNPKDLFGFVKTGVRQAQIPVDTEVFYDGCDFSSYEEPPTPRELIDSTVPSWFVGLLIHVLLAAGALTGAWYRTRTPAGRLTTGSRVA